MQRRGTSRVSESSVAIVVPVRLESTRFPGKALTELAGHEGLTYTAIEWVLLHAQAACSRLTESLHVYVATDSERLAAQVRRLGFEVVPTSAAAANGTERVAEAVKRAGIESDIVVNVQGDLVSFPDATLAIVVNALQSCPTAHVATLSMDCDASHSAQFRAFVEGGTPRVTSVIYDVSGRALYFSRHPLPALVQQSSHASHWPQVHIGVYAYRREALLEYPSLPVGQWEICEGLEQLRYLEHGYEVVVRQLEPKIAKHIVDINHPDDVRLIESTANLGASLIRS